MTAEPTQSPQSIFERNLSAFLTFARKRGAEVKEDWRLVYAGFTLSNNIRQDLAEWIEQLGWDDLKTRQLFWHHLMFERNLRAIKKFIETCRSYWGASWHTESVSVLLAADRYLSQCSEAFERPLTEKEIEAMWESLIQGVLGVSKPHEYMFERNLEAFVAFAKQKGAEVKNGAVVYQGVTLSADIRQDLAGYIENVGSVRAPMNPGSFWRHLVFRANCTAFTSYVERRHSYWSDSWHMEGSSMLIGVCQYLRDYDSQAYERLLTEKEMRALWEGLIQDALGWSKTHIPDYIFLRNLGAFLDYALKRGARVEDRRLVYQGVALTRRVRRKFVRVGFKGSDLTSRIQREIEGAGGRSEPVDPEEIWRRLVERDHKALSDREGVYEANLAAWRRFISDKGAFYDDYGRLGHGGKRVIINDEEFLRQQEPAMFERLLTDKDFERLWENLADYAARRNAWE